MAKCSFADNIKLIIVFFLEAVWENALYFFERHSRSINLKRKVRAPYNNVAGNARPPQGAD
ncbi:hypothetical protein OMAG_000086 [Candidatus Omnitrophus magneticus]|uniref:Uncharacterized protein n=1 Tax=Candidatus Omnitrophus magneticus TaxID=1609969 RepID=A0A0F0CRX1_9BACT|nr:hypothetical protein OMAG_000086 [Candidatus Omnitrophus magneticus]